MTGPDAIYVLIVSLITPVVVYFTTPDHYKKPRVITKADTFLAARLNYERAVRSHRSSFYMYKIDD